MAKKTLTPEQEVELKALQERATELEISFAASTKTETLKTKIAAAEAKLEKASANTEGTDESTNTETDTATEVAEEKSKKRRQCKGLFTMVDEDLFTQNENYSDEYLKSKGLFKED